MENDRKKKIVAVASIGGHWIQLLRITRTLESEFDVSYVSTHEKCGVMVNGHPYEQVADFSRWDAYKLIPAFFSYWKIFRKMRPDVILTTGAAPGLVALAVGKMMGIKTIWVDSIANVATLSASGRVAAKFATCVYTQWEDLSSDSIRYAGNVLNIQQ